MRISSNYFVLLSIVFLACNSQPGKKDNISYGVDPEPAKRIPAVQIVYSPYNFHGEYIETTATFFFEFENVALSLSPKLFGMEGGKSLWLDFEEQLFSDSTTIDRLSELSGQRLTVRGYLDASRHGHLGWYKATMRVHSYRPASIYEP